MKPCWERGNRPFPANANDKNMRMLEVPSKTQTEKGIAVEGFLLLALVAVYFVISYEQ